MDLLKSIFIYLYSCRLPPPSQHTTPTPAISPRPLCLVPRAVSSPGPVISNHAFGPPFDQLDKQSKVSYAMIEFFKPDNASITQMLVAQSNNRGVLAHCQHAVDEDSLAAFLVAAYPNAFFGTGKWYANGADAVSVDHWRPAFGFPLKKKKTKKTRRTARKRGVRRRCVHSPLRARERHLFRTQRHRQDRRVGLPRARHQSGRRQIENGMQKAMLPRVWATR